MINIIATCRYTKKLKLHVSNSYRFLLSYASESSEKKPDIAQVVQFHNAFIKTQSRRRDEHMEVLPCKIIKTTGKMHFYCQVNINQSVLTLNIDLRKIEHSHCSVYEHAIT